MSLHAKLFGAIGLTLCVVLGALVALTLVGERERATRVDAFRKAALLFAGDVLTITPPEQLQDTLLVKPNGKLHPDFRRLTVYGRGDDNEIVTVPSLSSDAEEPDAAKAEAIRKAVEQVFAGREILSGPGDSVIVPSRAGKGGEGLPQTVYYLELDPSPLDPVEITRVGFVVVVGAGVVLLLLTWLIVDRVVARPLSEVVQGARRAAGGDYGTPVPESGAHDEIQTVITAFNKMMVEFGTMQSRMRDRTQDALLTAKKTQESLVTAQRLASTGRLAAGIAHEVNNPLAGLLNAVHALRTKDMAPTKRDEYLEMIEDGLRRIQATVAKILQFRPHKVAPQPVDLENVVRPVLALVRHRVEKEEVEVVHEPARDAAVVFGDPYELQQALLNVVLNALDALDEADREHPRIEIVATVSPEEVHLTVRDNGTGMKEEDLPRAFELFFTTKEPGRGTGLGLATAHKILTDHGGRIDLRSRPGRGMDVEFVLPRLNP